MPHSGSLELDEFIQLMTTMGEKVGKTRSSREIEALFRKMDADGSGGLDAKEFLENFWEVFRAPEGMFSKT